ncbi:MAG TPA: hypothetical protein DCY13_18515 [Verrucomicrobiales bacterium]|nr:hypothetical protein [Verrucomicrobiales bacterium]
MLACNRLGWPADAEMNKLRTPRKLWIPVLLAMFVADAGWTEDRIHLVRRNDTLSSISRKYDVSTKVLAQWNALEDADYLRAGTRLKIPDSKEPMLRYIVQKGDSLAALAARHGQSIALLTRLNSLDRPDHIEPGQTLLIPGAQGQWSLPRAVRHEIDEAKIKVGRWKHIVIHHSSSKLDSPAIMDRHHRQVRHMENGLAYHFVIGGSGPRMKDGDIFIGDRWRGQLQGGHVASERLNQESIGICLIGNFNEEKPTSRQMESLAQLVEYLMDRCGLQPADVDTHTHINPKPTQCPGKHFSLADLRKRISRLAARR